MPKIDDNHVKNWVPVGRILECPSRLVYQIPETARVSANLPNSANFALVTMKEGFERGQVKNIRLFDTLDALKGEIKPQRLEEFGR